MFHLPERRHDREQHGPHRCRCVYAAAPRFSTRRPAPRPRSSLAKSSMFCVDRPSRSRVVMTSVFHPRERPARDRSGPRCSRTRDPLVDVEVVAPDTRGQDVGVLPVGGLLARRYARVSDQLRHSAPGCFITNGDYRHPTSRLCDVVMRIAAPRDSGQFRRSAKVNRERRETPYIRRDSSQIEAAIHHWRKRVVWIPTRAETHWRKSGAN